jgi:serine/threonine protein kinase
MSGSDQFEADLRSALGAGYEIERELQGSGMSRVFVATEHALNRKVVVKVLPPDLAAGVNRERFRREIQLAAQLQHPHIVPLHAAGASGDLLYFTMPYIEGESLRHALHEGVKFTPREVVRILHDVSDALAYAHSRGVIHRDIKPGNVLRSGAHAVVTDFGVAKAISAAMPAVGMTTSGMAIGTPAYMAPEQLAGDPAADHRVDIYAVGLLGYELLAGEAPFKASSPQETMAAQLTRAPEPISKRRPDAPPALATLLTRCLAKNPADRPQTAAEVVTLLDSLDVSSGAMMPQRAFTPARWWAVGTVVAAAAISAVALWPRSAPLPPPALVPESTTVINTAPTLTHEDSLAIARAIQKKISEQSASVAAKAESARTNAPPSTSAAASAAAAESLGRVMARMIDSLRTDIQKAVLDSVTRVRGVAPDYRFITSQAQLDSMVRRLGVRMGSRGPETERIFVEPPAPRPNPLSREAFAERAANLGPPRRLFVAYPNLSARSRFLSPQVDSVVDSLRATLARDGRYLLIPADSVRDMLARTRTTNTIAQAMQVDLFASVQVSVLPDTSILWQVAASDLTAHGAFSRRTVTMRGERSALLQGLDSLVTQAKAHLREMDRAPRRRPAAGDSR